MNYTYSLWNSQGQPTGWVAFPFSRGSSQPRDRGIKPRSPTMQVDSLPAEPQVKPKNTGVGSLFLLQRIFPTQGSNPGPPTLQKDSLPSEPQGKPKNTGVGSLFLLQGIFPTQELNQSLLHCRWILYQLSYQRSPNVSICLCKCQNGTVVSVGHRDRERTGKMINFDFIPLWFHYLHYAYINFIFGKKKRLMN